MNNRLKILIYLIEHKDEYINIRKLSGKTAINYKNTYEIIKGMEKEGIVLLEQEGKSSRISLQEQASPCIFDAEYERRKQVLKNKDISVMLDRFKSLNTAMYALLLFGSLAKGTSTKHSDIDLMFIIPDLSEEQMGRRIETIAGTIPLKLHISVFKEKDFIAMRKSREVTVGSEAIAHNVILHGIEQYYEMIQQ